MIGWCRIGWHRWRGLKTIRFAYPFRDMTSNRPTWVEVSVCDRCHRFKAAEVSP